MSTTAVFMQSRVRAVEGVPRRVSGGQGRSGAGKYMYVS